MAHIVNCHLPLISGRSHVIQCALFCFNLLQIKSKNKITPGGFLVFSLEKGVLGELCICWYHSELDSAFIPAD